MLMTNYLFLFL